MTDAPAGWPSPADFAAPPSTADRERWDDADRSARPARCERVRARFADAGIDADHIIDAALLAIDLGGSR